MESPLVKPPTEKTYAPRIKNFVITKFVFNVLSSSDVRYLIQINMIHCGSVGNTLSDKKVWDAQMDVKQYIKTIRRKWESIFYLLLKRHFDKKKGQIESLIFSAE